MLTFALLIVVVLGNGVIGDEAYIPYTNEWIYTFKADYSCPGREVMNITDITYGRCCRLWCGEWDLPETSTTYHNIISECHDQHSCRYIASHDYNNCAFFEREAEEQGLDFDYYTVYFTCNPGPVNPTETAHTLPSSSSNDVTEKWMLETLPGGEELTFPVSMVTLPQETTTVSEVPTAAASSVNPTAPVTLPQKTTTVSEVSTAAASSGSVDVTLVAGVTVGVAVIAAAVLTAIFVCRKRGSKEPRPTVRTGQAIYANVDETATSVNLQSQLGQPSLSNIDETATYVNQQSQPGQPSLSNIDETGTYVNPQSQLGEPSYNNIDETATSVDPQSQLGQPIYTGLDATATVVNLQSQRGQTIYTALATGGSPDII